MEIFLIRHATAQPAEAGLDDAERSLTKEGRRRFSECVHGLEALELRFDRVLSSPLLRARETAGLLASLSAGEQLVTEWLAQSPENELLAEIEALEAAGAKRVALVGHEPWMSVLLARLIANGAELAWSLGFKKGSVAWLEGRPAWGSMRLRAFLPPKILRQVKR